MAASVNCPQCDAPLELPDDIPAGKRLQCPDCGKAFAPTQPTEVAQPATRAPSRSRRPDDFELPPRRGKGGSIAIIAAIVGVTLVGLGIAGGFVWMYIDDLRRREEAENMYVHSKSSAPPKNVGPVGGPPGQGGMMPAGGMPGGPAGMPGAGGPGLAIQLQVGDVAPEIAGEDLDGKPMKLSDFRGKVVVLDFWGDWCLPCRAGYDYQNNLIKRLKDEPFVLLGVNCDTTKEEAKKAMKDHKLGWRAWHDSGGPAMTGPIYKKYAVSAVPRTFIIDKQGVIRQQFTGQALDVLIDPAVDAVLAQGENRPADAPPRWRPGSTGSSQLGEEVAVGRYRFRPPAGYIPEKVTPQAGRQVYRWRSPERADDKKPTLEITIAPIQDGANKLEDLLEKDLQAISSPRLGWSCEPAARGEVNSLTFARTHWSIMESHNPLKWKAFGSLYVSIDGDTVIRIAHQDALPSFNTGAEAAPLTFRKATDK